ncbi:MAG: MBL fold metallo-hydrolase [Actinobacteria bacterium]|nr:MAG: MBL fold metallo-hydrolase [Actinomycetota bacterium]
MLDVTFYGVRGSTPCSDERSMRYGGNTSCVLLQVAGQDPIILDLGTGLRYFGDVFSRTATAPFRGTALVTHLHWDHVQGLPFFHPLHTPGAHLDIVGNGGERSLSDAFGEFMTPPYFPIRVDDLTGNVSFRDIHDETIVVGDAIVTARSVPHVGATNGYRINWAGASVAYVSDHQQPRDDRTLVADAVLELCDGADLLIHDAQYTDDEFADRSHWGHCTIEYAIEVARQAKVRALVLFHHDPSHHDDFLDGVSADASQRSAQLGLGTVFTAYEGLRITLGHDSSVPIDLRDLCAQPYARNAAFRLATGAG